MKLLDFFGMIGEMVEKHPEAEVLTSDSVEAYQNCASGGIGNPIGVDLDFYVYEDNKYTFLSEFDSMDDMLEAVSGTPKKCVVLY